MVDVKPSAFLCFRKFCVHKDLPVIIGLRRIVLKNIAHTQVARFIACCLYIAQALLYLIAMNIIKLQLDIGNRVGLNLPPAPTLCALLMVLPVYLLLLLMIVSRCIDLYQ
jgi:hypothetical protein